MIARNHLSKLLYAASAALALACADRPTEPSKTSSPGNDAPTDPSFTTAYGFVGTQVGRGNLGTFHIQSKADKYDVELKSHDNTDIAVVNIDRSTRWAFGLALSSWSRAGGRENRSDHVLHGGRSQLFPPGSPRRYHIH